MLYIFHSFVFNNFISDAMDYTKCKIYGLY